VEPERVAGGLGDHGAELGVLYARELRRQRTGERRRRDPPLPPRPSVERRHRGHAEADPVDGEPARAQALYDVASEEGELLRPDRRVHPDLQRALLQVPDLGP